MRAARPNHCSPHAGKLYNTAETERCGQHVWGRRATRTPCTFQIPLLVNSHKCRMTRAPPTHSQRIKAKRIHTHVLLWRRRPKGRQQRGQSRKLGTCVLGQVANSRSHRNRYMRTHLHTCACLRAMSGARCFNRLTPDRHRPCAKPAPGSKRVLSYPTMRKSHCTANHIAPHVFSCPFATPIATSLSPSLCVQRAF